MTEKYTPPTEYIRSAWAGEREREFFERDGEAEFDRWLASVKAEAWSEGKSASTWRNPYRGEQS